jgi:hypothetical protein
MIDLSDYPSIHTKHRIDTLISNGSRLPIVDNDMKGYQHSVSRNGKFKVCPVLRGPMVRAMSLTEHVSRYEYVRNFERDEFLLPNTWIVVRIDGRGFHK